MMTTDSPTIPPRVLSIGVVVLDILTSPVERLPEPEKTLSISHVDFAVGGCAANTAHALSRLGFSVSLLGRIGDDVFGRLIRSALQKECIDLSYLEDDVHTPTSTSVVLIDNTGERRFLHRSGASGKLAIPADLPLSQFDFLHLGGCFLVPGCMGVPLVQLFRKAREKGVVTSIDTLWHTGGNWTDILSALPHTDYFMPSLLEAQMITGKQLPEEIARYLHDNGSEKVIIKMGERGAFVSTRQEQQVIPAFRVPEGKLKDTTGAGDAFVAGVLKGISLGWELTRAARLGNACGALATTHFGGPLMQDRHQLSEYIRKVQEDQSIF
ncbi:MAG TPA: carbohydrate kinase family protein [Candidatus Ozemobacteraceae bacterium]|nr:carbohydrate kinase family protein [Candidatus Ozemobacteraceae bacterium]